MESTWEEVLIRNAEGNSTEAQQEQHFEEPETGEDGERKPGSGEKAKENEECLWGKAKSKQIQ